MDRKEINYRLGLIKCALNNAEENSYRLQGANRNKVYYILNDIDFKIIEDCIDEIKDYVNETQNLY